MIVSYIFIAILYILSYPIMVFSKILIIFVSVN